MGFQKKGSWLRIILLLAGLAAMLWAFSGCGSEKGSPMSQEKERPATSDKPRLVEMIMPKSPSEDVVSQQLPLQRQWDPQNIEVLPPDEPGGRGVTLAEVAALASEALDPRTLEVIPPEIPGGRGVTQAEVDALARPSEMVQPSAEEITPR